MVLRKSFYIRWSAGRSPRVHEVNPGRDPSEIVDAKRIRDADTGKRKEGQPSSSSGKRKRTSVS